MHRTAAELRQITDPLRRRTEAKEAARQAYAELDALIQRAGPDGLLASDQRRFDALEREHRELSDLADDAVDELIGKIADAAGPVPMPAVAQVRDGKVVLSGSTGEVRANLPLPAGRSLTELPGHAGSSVEAAGSYFRDLIFGQVDKRALGEATGASGGFAVPTPHAAVILDLARKQAQVASAGAQVVPMTSETLTIAKLESDPVPSWRGENVLIPESDGTFGAVTFDVKSLAVITRISRELLEDAPNVEAAIVNALAQSFALEFDRVALYGAGTAVEPRGLVNVGGLATTDFGGANGAAPTNYGFIGRAIQRVRTRNYSPTGVLLAPRTEGDLSNLTATDGQPLVPSPYVAAVPRYETNQIPTNQTLGTSTDTSELFVGDFGNLMLGVRTSFGVLVLRERYADTGQVGLVAWLRGDVAVNRIAAFERVRGIRPVA